jgi:hypothetical protein
MTLQATLLSAFTGLYSTSCTAYLTSDTSAEPATSIITNWSLLAVRLTRAELEAT